MKIADRIHLVASGRAGFRLTDDYDCHVYLLDGGNEYALVDAGSGRDLPGLLAQVEADGLRLDRLRSLFLTHGHADHAAGAAGLQARLGLRVLASEPVARYVRDGDERAISLDVARRAGMYPPDFVFAPCPVDESLAGGATVQVGDLAVEALHTPGHASGHVTYVVRGFGSSSAGRVAAFTGDALFCGGTILLQHTWDCSVQESIRSVERLAALSIEGLFPGHGLFAVRHGRREVEKAMQSIARLLPPPQFL